MAPHSPATEQISTLLWIGFAAGAIVVVAVNVALLAVLRRRKGDSQPRQVAGGRRLQFRVASALTVFAAVLFVLGIVFTDNAQNTPTTGSAGLASAKSEPLTIEATGQQWLWRYSYPNGAFSYYKLVVPVDTAVKLRLVSTDVVHTWNVPDLAAKRDAVPGKVNWVVFSTGEEGDYTGSAATLSGQAYAAMRTEVEVVSPQAYEEWVEKQQENIQVAQEHVDGQIENGEVP